MQVRRFALLSVAVLLVVVSGSMFAQGARSPQEEQDAQALLNLVDAALISDIGLAAPPAPPAGAEPAAAPPTPTPLTFGAADRAEGEIALAWGSGHFIKGQSGATYLPFTLSVEDERLKDGAAFYVRIVNANQAAAFGDAMTALMAAPQGAEPPTLARPPVAWESLHFIDAPRNGKLERAVELSPGQYVAFVALKAKTPPPAGNDRGRNNRGAAAEAAAMPPPAPAGLLRHEITVPDFAAAELSTSSVIIAQSIEPLDRPLPPNEQESNPYVFGPMRITPSPDGAFSKSSELNVIFWIYGASAAASGKPEVTVGFRFHQQLPEGEKYFNRTAPQELNAETLPPEFSVEAGHQLPGSLVVPLASFPAGDYRLEITITDKAAGKEIVQNASFKVLPV